MTGADQSVRNTAQLLLQQYGDDASVIAVLRAAEFAAAGDAKSLDHWDQVIAFLEAFSGDEGKADVTH